MAWDWRNKDALRRKRPDAWSGFGRRPYETIGEKERFIIYDFSGWKSGLPS